MEVGLERIRDHVEKLVAQTIRKARERGIYVLTPDDPTEHGPMVVLRATDSDKAVAFLEKEGVITSNRHDGLRLSFYYYNVPEDVDAVFDVLDRHPELMVRTN
jgi:selenocysteine lyase/cysteine desulfurase